MIDASTLANLRSFAGQLPTLTEGAAEPDPAAVAAVYGLDADLPAYEPARLDMFARGVDPVLAGLPDAATDVAGALGDDESAAPVVELLGQLAGAVAGLGDLTRTARERGADPNALVDAAERYAWLHAAASCVHLWWANRDRSLYGTPPGSMRLAGRDARLSARPGRRRRPPSPRGRTDARARRRRGAAGDRPAVLRPARPTGHHPIGVLHVQGRPDRAGRAVGRAPR